MAYMNTPLGRPVSVEDWRAFQGDVVLKMLYDFGDDSGASLTVQSLCNGSALGVDGVREVALYLAEQGLATTDGANVRITHAGRQFTAACVGEYFLTAETFVFQAKMQKQMEESNAAILKQLEKMNPPGKLVALSNELREGILREFGVAESDWSKFEINAHVRLKPTSAVDAGQ